MPIEATASRNRTKELGITSPTLNQKNQLAVLIKSTQWKIWIFADLRHSLDTYTPRWRSQLAWRPRTAIRATVVPCHRYHLPCRREPSRRRRWSSRCCPRTPLDASITRDSPSTGKAPRTSTTCSYSSSITGHSNSRPSEPGAKPSAIARVRIFLM